VFPSRDERASRGWVRRLAFDVLQRSPSPRETATYLGAERGMVAARVLRTTEAMEVWLEEELFYFLLIDNFRPVTATIEQLPGLLRDGKLTAHRAIAEIILSTGFSLRNPGNDTFVTVVLEQCLGMNVQDRRNRAVLDAGKKLYDGQPGRFLNETGQSQADVVRIAIAHPDFTHKLLDRHHARLFGAPLPTARGRLSEPAAALVARLHADQSQFFTILAEWLTSEEYVAAVARRRPKNDRQFVRGLYMDLLGRTPSQDELRNMRNALQSMADPTPLRAVMAKLMLDSRDAALPQRSPGRDAELVRECFERYLGRQPTQTESTEFTAILGEPGTGVRHVVRALVGSAEYQYH
jgi:hypothetical protein